MNKVSRMLIVALAIMLIPSIAFADASPWKSAGSKGDQIKQKLDFGLKNMLFGWTELYTEPKEAHDSGDNIFAGIARGIGNAVVYTLGGVLHVATFPCTAIDVPLPDGGVDI